MERMTLQGQLLSAMQLSVDGDSFSFYVATIHYCVRNRLAKLTDYDLPELTPAEYEVIKQEVKDNKYGNARRMYTVRATGGRHFHMVLADTPNDAVSHIERVTGDIVVKVHDITDKGRWRVLNTWGGGQLLPALLDTIGNEPIYLGSYYKEEDAIIMSRELGKRTKNKEALGVYSLNREAEVIM